MTAKLEAFQSDAELVAAAISGALENDALETPEAEAITRSLFATRSFLNPYGGEKRIVVFSADGEFLSDSTRMNPPPQRWPEERKPELESIRILKNMAKFVLKLMPSGDPLPAYPQLDEATAIAADYPNAEEGLSGKISLSAWMQENGIVFLSASAPIRRDGQILGAILMTREARDIQEEVTRLWVDIMRVFLGTLLITIFAVYLFIRHNRSPFTKACPRRRLHAGRTFPRFRHS
ncbi:MAG: hypothetical protein LRY57_04930 [Alphaproteobacteria bacterium]|nr:hypothetical protein [Alphaproteobacteria bacterium]